MCETSQGQSILTDTLAQYSHSDLNVLLAKAIGKAFCMRAVAIVTRICLHYDMLISFMVHEGGIKEGWADASFEVLEGCIHWGFQCHLASWSHKNIALSERPGIKG